MYYRIITGRHRYLHVARESLVRRQKDSFAALLCYSPHHGGGRGTFVKPFTCRPKLVVDVALKGAYTGICLFVGKIVDLTHERSGDAAEPSPLQGSSGRETLADLAMVGERKSTRNTLAMASWLCLQSAAQVCPRSVALCLTALPSRRSFTYIEADMSRPTRPVHHMSLHTTWAVLQIDDHGTVGSYPHVRALKHETAH